MSGTRPIYDTAEENDFKFSGPSVWPKITAYSAVDRYIHRRPELSYLKARRKVLEEQPPPPTLRIIIVRNSRKGRRSQEKLGDFYHTIDHDDVKQDVIKYLENLRMSLCRIMPDEPVMSASIRIRIRHPETYLPLSSFQELWI